MHVCHYCGARLDSPPIVVGDGGLRVAFCGGECMRAYFAKHRN